MVRDGWARKNRGVEENLGSIQNAKHINLICGIFFLYIWFIDIYYNLGLEPDFVASFSIDKYVYFFFREVAIERENCERVVFSRVARICKVNSIFPFWVLLLVFPNNCEYLIVW